MTSITIKALYEPLLFIIVATLLLFSPKTHSAELENVQTGTVTLANGSTTNTTTITPVIDNKSILIFNLTTHSSASGPQDTHVLGQLNCSSGSCDEISFERYGSGDSATIRWQVVEFTAASSVTVQRGVVSQSSMSGSPPSTTISVGVNSAKSFVLLSEFVHGTVTSDDDFTRGQINSSGNLVLTVGEKKTSAVLAKIAWQVIEYLDANIQQDDVIFATTDSSKTIPISTVDTNKSLLVYNYFSTAKSPNTQICQNVVSGAIDNATTLQFNRGCANLNGEIHLTWFVIEFTDVSTVQHDKMSFSSSELSKTATLTNPVDTNCAITTTGYHQRGGMSPATVDHTSSAWFNAGLNAGGTEITLSRGQTNGVGAETGWSVIEFDGSNCPNTVVPTKCYALTDDHSLLYQFDLDASTAPTSVTMSKMFNGEGAAYRATNNALYAFDQAIKTSDDPSDLYKIDLDGTVTLIASNMISSRASGAEFVSYSDGTEKFIVLMDESESKIVTFDATDLPSKSPLKTLNLTYPDTSIAHVTSLAVDPATGEVLVTKKRGITAQNAKLDPTLVAPDDFPQIYSVNMDTGELTLKITPAIPIDAESLAFADDGKAYTESEDKDAADNTVHSLFHIDLATGVATAVEAADLSGDIETISCTGSSITTPVPTPAISGTVFQDDNTDDNHNSGEAVLPNITITLYEDVNNDGAIDGSDNSVGLASSDVNGMYTFNSLSSGNYLVQVDSTDTDIPANWAVGGTNPLVVTLGESDSTDQNFPFDATGCISPSGEINANLALPKRLKTTDKIFQAFSNLTDQTGSIKAYTIGSNGLPATTSWTATAHQNRATRLYTTQTDNVSKTLVNGLADDDAVFDNNGIPNNATIKNSIVSGSLGSLSPDSNMVLLDNSVDTFKYLRDVDYKSFYTSTISARSAEANATIPRQILVSSDDGFLYALKQSDGSLGWGWMPRSLVKQLKHAATFKDQHFMQGIIGQLDLRTGSAGSYSYDSYVVGSYRNGLGQYVLKLDSDSSLSSIIWDTDHKDSNVLADRAPNLGKRAYFSDADQKRYMAYVITNTTDESVLHIRSITDTTVHYQINLSFTATSTPFVMPEFKGTAPADNTLYLGDSNGNIYSAPLLQTSGADIGDLIAEDSLTTALTNPTAVTAMNTADSSPVQYIGASSSKYGNTIYLRAQSTDRLTVFKFITTDSTWQRTWTTTIGSAGKWVNGSATLTADTNITQLPATSSITDELYVTAASLVVPVTVAPTGSSCFGTAYYYFYSLSDGHVPTKTFYNQGDDSAIGGTLALGQGDAKQLRITEHPGTKKLMGFGMADKKANGTTGVNTAMYIEDPVSTGVRSWKILK